MSKCQTNHQTIGGQISQICATKASYGADKNVKTDTHEEQITPHILLNA